MIVRYDTAPINQLTIDPQTGFLHASNVPIARAGVFPYLHADGTMSYEAKLPQDILGDSTVQTAANKPITDDHPTNNGGTVLVNKGNVQQYMKGFSADNAHVEGDTLRVGLTVTDPTLIKKIQGGKQELSIGFQTDVAPAHGVFQGMKYDSIQKNIQINHIAVVDRAREGHNIRITGDSAAMIVDDRKDKDMGEKNKRYDDANSDTPSNSNANSTSNSTSSGSGDDKDKQIADLKKQVADLTAQLQKLQGNNSEDQEQDADDEKKDPSGSNSSNASSSSSSSEGSNSNSSSSSSSSSDDDEKKKAAQANAKADALEKEVAELKRKYEGDGFTKAVANRMELLKSSKRFLGDSYDFTGKDAKTIKADAIEAVDGIDLSGRGNDYIDAYYDSIMHRKSSVVGYVGQEVKGDSAESEAMKLRNERYNLYNKGVK